MTPCGRRECGHDAGAHYPTGSSWGWCLIDGCDCQVFSWIIETGADAPVGDAA